VKLSGSVNGRPRTFTYAAEFPARDAAHGFIPRLWATRRVGFLLDQIRLHGESAELRDEVTRLARLYGIVTPYTAYLIVEDESRRNVPVTSRTLQAIDGDEKLVTETRRRYKEMKDESSGAGVVGGVQSNSTLKQAEVVSAPAEANVHARKGYAGAAAPESARVDQAISAQANRFIAGRNFFQNGSQWIDANVQAKPGARRVQVKFNSAEYFDLMGKHPSMPQWLSVGRNVQVALGDTVYEIVE